MTCLDAAYTILKTAGPLLPAFPVTHQRAPVSPLAERQQLAAQRPQRATPLPPVW